MRFAIVFVLVMLCGLRGQAGAAQVSPLVASGVDSPLALPFSTFTDVSIDDAGSVVFLGTSSGSFTGTSAPHADVVSAGDPLSNAQRVAGVSQPVAAPNGCAVVRAFLVGGGSAVVRRCGGQGALETLLADGATVADPSTPGGDVIAQLLGAPAAAGGGWVACAATLTDGRDAVIRTRSGDTPTVVAATRSFAPGSGGGTLSGVRLIGVAADGRVGFRGIVSGGPDGIFVTDAAGTGASAVVVIHDAAPSGGGSFRELGGASMNDAGTFALHGTTSGTAGTREGIFRFDGPAGGLRQPGIAVALSGDATDQPGVTYRGFPSSLVPAVNNAGVVAFRATLSGSDSGSAIFVAAPGSTPGQVVGVGRLVNGNSLVRLRDPAIADDGGVVFPASITGKGPGIFMVRAGVFSTLAAFGDRTERDPGQQRFRFSAPSVRERGEDTVFLGSLEGIFRHRADGTLDTLAFVGGPTVIGGTYADLDPPAAGHGDVVFGAEVADGQASRVLVRVSSSNRDQAVAVAGGKAVGRARYVDFFAGTLDSLQRADVGPHGEIAFEASLEGKGAPARALVLKRGRRTTFIAASGKRGPRGTYQGFGTPSLLGGTQAAYVAQVDVGSGRPDLLIARRRKPAVVLGEGDGLKGRASGTVDQIDPPDAATRLVVARVLLSEGGKEAVIVQDRKNTAVVATTGDAAGEGRTFRSFQRPVAGDGGIAFLARHQATSDAPSLYRMALTSAPAEDTAMPGERLIGAGTPSPLGGSFGQLTALDGNRGGTLVVVADLVGASANSAIFVVSVP